ncbi:MAG TPA: MMPL family transporter [Actinomycetota bacterium]|nr:MMPL family transporter [Actinomycetota bacterium]
MSWEGLARFVLRHPGRVLGVSAVALILPALGLLGARTSFDLVGELDPTADSVRGFEALEGSFHPGQVQPMVVIGRARKTVWTDEAFAAVDQLTLNLRKVPGVTEVRSITRPTEGGVSQAQLQAVGLGDVASLTKQLPRANRGLERTVSALRRMRDGLRQILAGVPDQRSDAAQAREGIGRMRAGIDRIVRGLGRLGPALEEAARGLERLASEGADPALASLEAAWENLKQTTVARTDPRFPDLAKNVGEALAVISGRCPDPTGLGPPDPACPPGRKLDPEYEGLAPTLRALADGLRRADDGVSRVVDGLGAIDEGLARLEAGFEDVGPQLARLESGVQRMVAGIGRIIPGLERLRRELVAGASTIQESGLLPDPTGDVAITASLAQAFPKLREQLAFFTGDGGRATRVFVTLNSSAYEDRALDAAHEITEVTRLSFRDTPLETDQPLVTGAASFFADVRDVSGRDMIVIVWAVIIGVLIVLMILLRSVVAPVYLVLTVLLSFASTLGLTALVFQGLFDEPGLVWWLPNFLFVLLVALGADYNIFLSGRIREEAERTDARDAVARGLGATGRVITSAGLILAGTFAALLAAPLDGMVQLGFAATTGILVDTFVVRSLLVPSIAVLLGSASWWPSARAARA